MRWSYWEVMAMPLPVVNAAMRFVNEHVVGQGGTDVDDDWS